jgi:hypothetical protein
MERVGVRDEGVTDVAERGEYNVKQRTEVLLDAIHPPT